MGRPFFFPGRTIVVTGGANGIGYALAERFLAEGATRVVLADLDGERAKSAAAELGVGAQGYALDVTDPEALAEVIEAVEEESPIDLWCSNAGISTGGGLGSAADWDITWKLHVQAHVHVARLLIPRMIERGQGHLLITASAAGLLTNIDSAPYSVTKHGAVALAEWLAIQHADDGVDVSCLCPMGVNTAMTAGDGPDAATRLGGDYIEPADVAESVVEALTEGRFLILSQPQASIMEQRRVSDRDRWLSGMRRAKARLKAGG